MRRRIILTSVLLLSLVMGAPQVQPVVLATYMGSDNPGIEVPANKSGIGKLFKALGRIFGVGKKDSDKQKSRQQGQIEEPNSRPVGVEPVTEKDAAKFASVGSMRVTDGLPAESAESAPHQQTAEEHLARGRQWLEKGHFSWAITELSSAVWMNPKSSEAHNLLGLAYERKGLSELARKSYEQALEAAGDDPQVLNNLGYSFYLNGDYRAAVDRLKRAAKLAPNDERILNNLALAQCRLGKYGDALKSFVRAGGEFNGRYNVATMLERAGRDAEAIEQYEKALRVAPNSLAALRRLADLYQRTGRFNQAQAARAALESYAAHAPARGRN